MGGGDTKKTTVDQTTNKSPLAAQEPFYKDLWAQAHQAMTANQAQGGYTGDFLAPKTGQEQQGVDLLTQGAAQQGVGADAVRSLALKTLAGGFLPDLQQYTRNPNLDSVIQGALDPITKSLTTEVLPGISSAAISSGAYGGARQDLSQERAVSDFGKTAAQTTSNIAYKDFNDYMNRSYALYGQERGLQTAAPALLDAANNLSNAPAMQLLKAGQTQRSLDQIALENNQAKFGEQRNSQWYGLGELANILASGGFGTAHTTGTNTEVTQSDPFTQLLKGITGGVSLASGLGWKPFG